MSSVLISSFMPFIDRPTRSRYADPLRIYSKTLMVIMMRQLSYRIILRKEPEGGYTVLVPSLPGCVTYGKTVEEAINMARDAIKGYVESLIEDGEEVPVEEELLECRLTVEAHA
jgi:antitoxin HicB